MIFFLNTKLRLIIDSDYGGRVHFVVSFTPKPEVFQYFCHLEKVALEPLLLVYYLCWYIILSINMLR